MSDLISRNKIYNYIKAQINPYGKPFEGDVYEFGIKLMEYIEQMDAEESVTDTNIGSKWIPCSERLPEEDKMSEYYESVIVTLDNGRVVNGCYRNTDEEWWVDAEDGEKYSINVTGHVIAWCPLPEPYKGE